jgi:hypothetical protein
LDPAQGERGQATAQIRNIVPSLTATGVTDVTPVCISENIEMFFETVLAFTDI